MCSKIGLVLFMCLFYFFNVRTLKNGEQIKAK